VVSGGRGRWRARGAESCGAGVAGAQEMAGEGGGVTGASRARGGLEVDEGELVWNFPKMQGLHCKDKTTFKP
jgi:hypothetical protein